MSINKFNAVFQMFLNTKLMGLTATKCIVKEILALAEQGYAKMLAEPGRFGTGIG
jgi:hypothetical protein